ncbi:MAG: ABC transporter ATP-binding protein [Planctomycetes bacterium]|nr:ABC transporter ATP-binding protein [Planctomycetota bacterium]
MVAVDGMDLRVEPGELACLVGPSGCGKSTLLRLIGGYLAPDAGAVRIDGVEVAGAPPERRSVGTVFQSYALFPHLSARENVAFGLRVRRVPAAQLRARVDAALDWVALDARARERRPRELSGGQQQRVALARVLVTEPRVLLLDEPFANLDRALRERLGEELRALQRARNLATVLVTHDQDEALALADRVAVMHAGRLEQVDAPAGVYERPRSAFVAAFFGAANLLRVVAVTGDALVLEGGLRLAAQALGAARAGDHVLVRPERLEVSVSAAGGPATDGDDGGASWRAQVVSATYRGADALLTLDAGGAALRARVAAKERPPAAGARVRVEVPAGAAWLVPASGRPLPETAAALT